MSDDQPECIDFSQFIKNVIENRQKYDVVICEGAKLLHDSRLEKLCNYIFFIDIPQAMARERRTRPRDQKLNPVPMKAEYFDNLLWPAHRRYVKNKVEPV